MPASLFRLAQLNTTNTKHTLRFASIFKLQKFPITPFWFAYAATVCISIAAVSSPTTTKASTCRLQMGVVYYMLLITISLEKISVNTSADSDELKAFTPSSKILTWNVWLKKVTGLTSPSHTPKHIHKHRKRQVSPIFQLCLSLCIRPSHPHLYPCVWVCDRESFNLKDKNTFSK